MVRKAATSRNHTAQASARGGGGTEADRASRLLKGRHSHMMRAAHSGELRTALYGQQVQYSGARRQMEGG